MECRTARILLEFARPQAPELQPADQSDLERHLASCQACRSLHESERHLDDLLGKAMRQVEVPVAFRAALLGKLDADRSAWYRHWLGHGCRFLAAAAAIMLIVWAALRWRDEQLPSLDVVALTEEANRHAGQAATPEEVEDAFRKQHKLQVIAPRDLNYAYLIDYRLADLQGRQVPQLLFIRTDDAHGVHARVYIVSARQFNLRTLPADYQSSSAQPQKVEIRHREGEPFAYLVVHSGDSLDWLLARTIGG